MKLVLLFLLGSFIYGLWLSLPGRQSGGGKEEVIDLKEGEDGKFEVE